MPIKVKTCPIKQASTTKPAPTSLCSGVHAYMTIPRSSEAPDPRSPCAGWIIVPD
ncbi:MAG: hypothetical protein JW839_01065 [Candidatus Lokiarchaeota archaeon]|nr:hypothetical protein [Candidatus Lokiarchaeota archaeon]